MRRYILGLLIGFGLTLSLNVAQADQTVQRYTYDEIEHQVAGPASLSFYSGAVTIAPSVLMSAAGVKVEVRRLGIVPDGGMGIPQEYKSVAGVYQIDLGLREVDSPVSVNFQFSSTLKFPKFAMQFDEVKGSWKEISSTTDLVGKVISFKLSKASQIVTVLDTDTMIYGKSSWYRYKKCNCAASPDYPKGTQLLVTNLNKNQAIVVKVNDWGPERDLFPDRVIDLDLVAFEKLGKKGMGVLTNIMVLPYREEDFDAQQVKDLKAGKMIQLDEVKVASLKPEANEAMATVPVVQTPNPNSQIPITKSQSSINQPAPTTSTNTWSGTGFYFLDN